MDRSIWEAIGDLRARMKALEQRSGIRGAGTMAVAMAPTPQEQHVVCPACKGSGTNDGETCPGCGGRGIVDDDLDDDALEAMG